ncbi:MAG: T9SS type A sorting domain-containing protein [Thermoanaerobaculia bacterium]|nr:T9SS type A sorting domain-containing protein [Thermoanaerobaculia bacterium]
MKYFIFCLLVLPQIALGQKHDYIWVSGDSNNPNTTSHGGMVIDFNQNPVDVSYKYRKLNMFVCNASICDSLGRLMAYTNGCDIAGADDEIMENGEMINPGYAWQVSCIQNADGYASGIQSAVFLPLPDHDSLYYLFHKQMKLLSNFSDAYTEKLLFSVVDRRSESNYGKVIQKNIEILNDTLAYGKLIATKHANGKDWWIITPRRKNNVFYILKFTKEGIVDTFTQKIGITPDYKTEGYGQIVFSSDGTKVFRTNPSSPIMVYDFDREAGVFTHFDTIPYEYGDQPIVGEIGCALSPSGRFLYLSCRIFLYQLDLWAPDISASQTVVAEWDGFKNPFPTTFWQCQLGPDCKIYIRAGGDTRYFHVIHNPEEPGLACNVEQRGLPLPTPSGSSMPSFPNYCLGPADDPGLPCSPVVSTTAPPTPLPAFSVFPNPVSTTLKIVPNRQYDGPTRLRLYDVTGRLAKEQIFDPQLPATEADVRDLGAGVYFYEVWCEGKVQRAGRVVRVD